MEKLFNEQRYYIDWIVYKFLLSHPTFFYLKEDWEAECYLYFIQVMPEFIPERMKLSSFIYMTCMNRLGHLHRNEVRMGVKAQRLRDATPECRYDDSFETWNSLTSPLETELQKEIFYMKFKEGLSSEEVATVLGVSRQAVHQCYLRGLTLIRNDIAELESCLQNEDK